jgi:hypothetical protein
MVVKVQQSLMTTAQQQQVLIYNEDQTVRFHGALTPELSRRLAGRLKVFMRASLGKDGKINLHEIVEDKNW